MSKHKIICLALCGLMLTSCGNSGENTAAETSAPETEQASESVSETVKTQAETVIETEAPESSETVPEETESTENCGGFGGEYILRYDGSGIDGEVIDRAEYETYGQEDENGEWYRIRDDFYYIFGEEVTEEEYDSKKKEYFDGLQPSDALYVQSSMGSRENSEFTENLADALEKYLDMRDGADKST